MKVNVNFAGHIQKNIFLFKYENMHFVYNLVIYLPSHAE
jgi:hypothetical protein